MSEARAAKTLARRRSDARLEALHSVHSESAVTPAEHDARGVIDRDFPCGRCGYNLRSRAPGEPCPECDFVQFARPVALDKPGYAQWLDERRENTRRATRWGTLLLIGVVGGLTSVVGTFVAQLSMGTMTGVVALVFIGPTIEELMKVALVAAIIETRPYLFRSSQAILFGAVAAGFGFAALENLIYLNVYIRNPDSWLVAWRWTVCVGLHTGCTAIAAIGLARVWREAMANLSPPRMAVAFPWMVAAIVVHGFYNALMLVLEIADVI